MRNITLALDTTSSPLLLAFEYNGKIYSVKKAGIKQEELLFPSLKKLFTKAGVEMKDIKKVFFLRGPGRFTGIRISITLASMLRALNGADAASMTVFEFLNFQIARTAAYKKWLKANEGGVHAVVLHAFREEYFLQFFDGSAPMWLSKEDMLLKLKTYKAPLFISGFDKEKSSLTNLIHGFTLASDKNSKLSPKVLCEAAAQTNFEQNSLEPLYLKPARFETGK